MFMRIFNPLSLVTQKIQKALEKKTAALSVPLPPSLSATVVDLVALLKASPQASDQELANALNIDLAQMQADIKQARGLILKEQLLTPATALTMVPTGVDGTVVTGTWVDDQGQVPQAIPQIVIRMEEHRKVAENFQEDEAGFAESAVRFGAKFLFYVGPVILAFFVAMLIGEQYAKLDATSFWWRPAMYAIAVVTEGSLWGVSFGASREFRRMLTNRKHVSTFVTLTTFFLAFSAMSVLAQWFVYERHFVNPDFPTIVGIVFRTCSTTGTDIAALLVLAVLDFKDFKAFLEKRKQIAAHVGQMSRQEIENERLTNEEVVRQQKALIQNEQEIAEAKFWADRRRADMESMSNGGSQSRGRW